MEYETFDAAYEAVRSIIEDESSSCTNRRDRVIEFLSQFGIDQARAASFRPPPRDGSAPFSPQQFGALNGLGWALTDEVCQVALFEAIEPILIKANDCLRCAFTIGIFEPLLRGSLDLTDVGFTGYLLWFFKLEANPQTRWAVDEAYDLHGVERRLADRRLIAEWTEQRSGDRP